MIPLVAIIVSLVTGNSDTNQISIEAIIEAPFLLATLGMFVVGTSALSFRHRRESGSEIAIHQEVTRRDLRYFLPFFLVTGVAGFFSVPFFAKVGLAVILVGAYSYYVWQTIEGGGEEQEESLGNLLLWPSSWGRLLPGPSLRRW